MALLSRVRRSRKHHNATVAAEIRDVAPGLWIWRGEHPDWSEESSFAPPVTSTCVESRREVLVLDALAPPEEAREVWERLDAAPAQGAVVLRRDRVRRGDRRVGR